MDLFKECLGVVFAFSVILCLICCIFSFVLLIIGFVTGKDLYT